MIDSTLSSTAILVAKAIFLLLGLGYLIFSIVIANQIRLMADTLITKTSPLLKAISIVHLIAVLTVFLFIIKILI